MVVITKIVLDLQHFLLDITRQRMATRIWTEANFWTEHSSDYYTFYYNLGYDTQLYIAEEPIEQKGNMFYTMC